MNKLIIALSLVIGQVFISGGGFEITTIQHRNEGGPTTINAVGESAGTIGYIWFEGGITGTKTCSSAGGCQIMLPTASVTWAGTGVTNLRVGFQDVNLTTGLEDGTFDVQMDLVPGTETVAGNTAAFYATESGTKDLTARTVPYAMVTEMTARGGTDSVQVEVVNANIFNYGFPYGTGDSGTLARTFNPAPYMILFDDGTYGWFQNVPDTRNFALGRTNLTVNTGTNPDEVGFTCQFPVTMKIDGFGFWLSAIATTDPFEYTIYENPYTTTPDVIWGPITVDPDQVLNDGIVRQFEDDLVVPALTDIAFMFKPTSANSITFEYFLLPSGTNVATAMKKGQFFLSPKMAGRIDGSGIFTETNALHLPSFVVHLPGLVSEPYGGTDFPALFLAP